LDSFIEHIGKLAVKSILYEVSATPKPGLVDRCNNGAHNDMGFFTFIDSIVSLSDSFKEFARIGFRKSGEPPQSIFASLQRYGKDVEQDMFKSTGGVNTHKGTVFLCGLICAAAGLLHKQGEITIENICSVIASMCTDLCGNAFQGIKHKKQPTKGEMVYIAYGLTGIRGEAESGLKTVRQVSMPVLEGLLDTGICINDILVHTLINLIAKTADTNIYARHGHEAALYARDQAEVALSLGGMLTPEGRAYIDKMDHDFISRMISPSGSADLLAATYLLHALEAEHVNYTGIR